LFGSSIVVEGNKVRTREKEDSKNRKKNKETEIYKGRIKEKKEGTLNPKPGGLSPQANYTERATAAVGQVVPTFAGRGCYMVSATDSHGR
jgi:hypothetical protein